jgi:hypothetical protein
MQDLRQPPLTQTMKKKVLDHALPRHTIRRSIDTSCIYPIHSSRCNVRRGIAVSDNRCGMIMFVSWASEIKRDRRIQSCACLPSQVPSVMINRDIHLQRNLALSRVLSTQHLPHRRPW